MREMTCSECGASFYPVCEAWGDSLCGDCIASRIELSLLPMALRELRKPMRRAAQQDEAQAWTDSLEHRKAG